MQRLVTAIAALCLAAAPVQSATSVPAAPVNFQSSFDYIGPPVEALRVPGGRTIHYADTGEKGWRPVLYLGGTGTSARSFLMTGYLETLRQQLHLRFITVERNGFGDTPYDPDWGYADYVGEVKAVLDHLGTGKFAMLAISGGGPYAAHIAAALPDRLISVHMAAALANLRGAQGDTCSLSTADLAATGGMKAVQNPQAWWDMPATSSTKHIPGFADRAYDEGARAFFIRGQVGDPTPEAAEMHRYCGKDLPDLAGVKAPLFTYYGGADTLVVPANGAYWRAHFGGPKTERDYPGEWHDVQYRHWDQVMIDLAGFGDRVLVCSGGKGMLAAPAAVPGLMIKGATIGVCAWR
jgi:non-heme chloroperoxidase